MQGVLGLYENMTTEHTFVICLQKIVPNQHHGQKTNNHKRKYIMKHSIKLGMTALACCCLSGCGGNDAEIAQKDIRAISEYVARNDYSDGIKYIDMKRAKNFKAWTRAAEKGTPEGQLLLGRCYLEGIGVDEDKTVGATWCRKAADQGYAEAQYLIGVCYFDGEGVDKDIKEAMNWYRKAAEQGHAEAQCEIGECYYNGRGVPENWTEAAQWYRKAAEQGHAEAQYKIGQCYYYGKGVPEDGKEAVQWYQKAAAQGHTEAQKALKN